MLHPQAVQEAQRHPLSERANDTYETPEVAVEALLRHEKPPRRIWEPACGSGNIARVLRRHSRHVLATDLVDYHSPDQDSAGWDFLMERQAPPRVQGIVSNPPYKIAGEFIEHALELVPYVAMLLRVQFLEGSSKRRCFLLDGGSLARVHIFRNRLPRMHRHGWTGRKAGSRLAFAWYIWDRKHEGPTTINRISWQAPVNGDASAG